MDRHRGQQEGNLVSGASGGPWQAVLIDAQLTSRAVAQSETFEGCVRASGERFTDSECRRAARGHITLTEENVETLLTAAFRDVFAADDLMLIARQRALFQIPDLLAVDHLGRLTIVEVKNRPPKPVDIVSQVSEYLVQCAQRDPTELAWLMRDYYRRFADFHPLYHAALLLRRSLEHMPALGSFLRENGLYQDQKQDSARGGDTYFRRMRSIVTPFIRSKYGVDVESSVKEVLLQGRGDIAYAQSDLLTAMKRQFGYGQSQAAAVAQALNRRWRQVYFAPSFWFNRNDKQPEAPDLTAALADMYRRGMEMSFIEYTVVCKEEHSPPWLLAWRETTDWLTSLHADNRALKWRNADPTFDRYSAKMLSSGYWLKKDPGMYETWRVVYPECEDLVLEWPLGRDTDRLSAGRVRFQSGRPDTEHLLAIRGRALEAVSSLPGVRVSISHGGTEARLQWDGAGCAADADPAEVASAITSAVLAGWPVSQGR